MKLRAVLAAVAMLSLATPLVAAADETEPYGNHATGKIADQLHGRDRAAWFATTLDAGDFNGSGYSGPRHAEIVRIPPGHGKRFVGIIHVPPRNAAAARKALAGVWLAKKGAMFVVPLQSSTDTEGGTARPYKQATAWAARTLGRGWRTIAP